MERLTIEYDWNYVPKALCSIDRCGGADDCDDCANYCKDCEGTCDLCEIQKCFDKLGEYENTNLTPEQILEIDKAFSEQAKELGEYKKLEEQGLLLKLPCKVGDTVYTLNTLSRGKIVIAETTADAFFCALCMIENRLGKTVFLTKEEAEAKLKEMEGK